MRRNAGFVLTIACGAGFGLQVGGTAAAQGTGTPPDDIHTLVTRMAKQVQVIGDGLAATGKASDKIVPRVEEAREIARSMLDFASTLGTRPDAFRIRKGYSGIDASWHHLAYALSKGKETPAAVVKAMKDAEGTDTLIHKALKVNEVAVYYGMNAPAEGVPELKRLTHALVDRAEALAEEARAEVPGAQGSRLVEKARNLAQSSDIYHDAINLNGRLDATVQNGFAPIEGMDDSFAKDLAQVPNAPRTKAAWKSYKSVELLIRQALNLPARAADAAADVPAAPAAPAVPVSELADRLVFQAARLSDVLGPRYATIDEGPQFMADSQDLQRAAIRFRAQAARAVNPNELAFQFRDIDALWLRLARRATRMGRGRAGLDMDMVSQMGQTVAELHRVLGIPGFPSLVGQTP